MERLDFRLDDFTRVQWAPGARSVWEPKIQAVNQAWQEIEIDLVLAGVKPSALLVVGPERLPELSRRLSLSNLSIVVLGMQGRTNAPYASTTMPYTPGQPFDYRVAVTTSNLADHWLDAWDARNDAVIGTLLGYPQCCREFFQKYWVDQGFVDLTWFQALNCPGVMHDSNIVDVSPNPLCNVTLRTLGIRAVSHLPCSFVCEHTAEIGGESLRLIKANYPTLHRTIQEILNWPVKWSALHGIAEITTPVCRIITRTDATPSNYVVRQHGALYPEEGSRGLEFPFREDVPKKVQLIRRDTWSDNGFSSFEAMTEAHNIVLKTAGDLSGKIVIDLGCGNGELLRKIKVVASEIHGVDLNSEALEKATKFAFVQRLNIFDLRVFERPYDVAFISVQRLMEQPDDVVANFIELLKLRTKSVVFYSYAPSEGWEKLKALGKSSLEVISGQVTAARFDWRGADDSGSDEE